jgi:hypothetical protein
VAGVLFATGQFGRLDSKPLLSTALHVGDELAMGYDKVVEHREASDCERQ